MNFWFGVATGWAAAFVFLLMFILTIIVIMFQWFYKTWPMLVQVYFAQRLEFIDKLSQVPGNKKETNQQIQ